MRKILGTVLIGSMVTVGGGIVRAGPFEDGVAAYQRGDFATALELFRSLAEKGNASAQFNLGLMYAQGRGVPQDFVHAHMWSNLAASKLRGDDAQVAAQRRDIIERGLSTAQVARAQEMARQCEARKFKGCD